MYPELSPQEQDLINRIKVRVKRDATRTTFSTKVSTFGFPSKIYSVATAYQIADAEKAIGFSLPALIREIYLQVGNGGFGPGYGIVSIDSGFTIYDQTLVELTLDSRKTINLAREYFDSQWDWKDSYLMYGYWGCNITTVVDCALPQLPIYKLDAGDWGFHPAKTLFQWWLDWLDDKIQQT